MEPIRRRAPSQAEDVQCSVFCRDWAIPDAVDAALASAYGNSPVSEMGDQRQKTMFLIGSKRASADDHPDQTASGPLEVSMRRRGSPPDEE